jgi:hypothetical protein
MEISLDLATSSALSWGLEAASASEKKVLSRLLASRVRLERDFQKCQ